MQGLRRVLPSLRNGVPQDGRLIRKNKSPVPRSVTWVPAHGEACLNGLILLRPRHAYFPETVPPVASIGG